jgi:hypothetical protein
MREMHLDGADSDEERLGDVAVGHAVGGKSGDA